jgi:hypothetical protein
VEKFFSKEAQKKVGGHDRQYVAVKLLRHQRIEIHKTTT